MKTIYADHAATTALRPEARDAMLPYFDQIYANASSLHTPGQEAAAALLTLRTSMATFLGCQPSELYFTSGGTESDNQALRSAAALGARKGKRHLVSTTIEHHAILHTLQQLEKEGYEVTLVPVEADGIVRPEAVEAALREDTAVVSVMYANNEIGTIQPIEAIGALCRERKILFHTDAVQAVGHLPIRLSDLPVDMLSLSAHKFGGLKGVGALYVRKGVQLLPFLQGGAQERGKRPGTENLPGIAAMAKAMEVSLRRLPETSARLITLRDALIAGLLTIPHTALNGDATQRLPGNVNVCFEGIEGESLLLLLDQQGIAASSGSACTSGSLDPSHVLLAIGRPHEVAHGSLRLTLGEETTQEDIEHIIQATGEVVAYLRGMSPVWRDLQEGRRNYVIQ